MAVYKVPQDVEADDKLIGPFSFRQFIYLVIVTMCIMLAWGLWQLFIPLAFIPVPVIIFFGALALPLRKDQPMEIYMAAMVSFYLKPHKRLWDPDGIDSLIEITVPKIVEVQRIKDISQTEAQRRFGYLAEIVDTQGWAVRGTGIQAPSSNAMTTDAYFEAQQVPDVLDVESTAAQAISDKLDQSDAKRRKEMEDIVNGKVYTIPKPDIPPPTPGPASYVNDNPLTEPVEEPEPVDEKPPEYNPYPEINQSVIEPMGEKRVPEKPVVIEAPTTSEKVVSPDIMKLADDNDLSIATIAQQANRIQKKQDEGEVFISLR